MAAYASEVEGEIEADFIVYSVRDADAAVVDTLSGVEAAGAVRVSTTTEAVASAVTEGYEAEAAEY